MKVLQSIAIVSVVTVALGCQPKETASVKVESKPSTTAILVATEPVGAKPVGEARVETKDGQEVTLVGRIGGSTKPFVEGLAAFTIVDEKVPYCADDEGCPTPWDYCCETDAVKSNIATIKIVDEAGKPMAESARELLKVNELSVVVVKGKSRRDEQGNLTVAANQVFVRSGK